MSEYSELIRSNARKYGVDPVLIAAIIVQESSEYPFSFRYEEGFYQWLLRTLKKRPILLGYVPRKYGITLATERKARAFSYGLMQIMGETAREYGFDRESLLELTNPELNIELGCKIVQKLFIKHANEEKVLLRWNGGGDPDYPRRVLSHIKSGRAQLLLSFN